MRLSKVSIVINMILFVQLIRSTLGITGGSFRRNKKHSGTRYSHANMIVFGKDCFIISKSGKEAIVNDFTDQVGNITVPIVNAAVAYDYPWSQITYILIAKNILSVPSMDHNLIPSFILREAGLTVNDTAMIHLNEPPIDDNAISFPTLI